MSRMAPADLTLNSDLPLCVFDANVHDLELVEDREGDGLPARGRQVRHLGQSSVVHRQRRQEHASKIEYARSQAVVLTVAEDEAFHLQRTEDAEQRRLVDVESMCERVECPFRLPRRKGEEDQNGSRQDLETVLLVHVDVRCTFDHEAASLPCA